MALMLGATGPLPPFPITPGLSSEPALKGGIPLLTIIYPVARGHVRLMRRLARRMPTQEEGYDPQELGYTRYYQVSSFYPV